MFDEDEIQDRIEENETGGAVTQPGKHVALIYDHPMTSYTISVVFFYLARHS